MSKSNRNESKFEVPFDREVRNVIRSIGHNFSRGVRDIEKSLGTRKLSRTTSADRLRRITDGEGLEKRLEVLGQRFQQVFSDGKRAVAQKLAESKILKVSQRTLLLVGVATSLMVAGTEGSHALTRYKISTTRDPEGVVSFVHEDTQTTEIIDYLSGRKPLTEDQKLHIYRGYIRMLYTDCKKTPPANLESLTRTELAPLVYAYYKDVLKDSDKEAQEETNDFFTEAVPEYEYDAKLYSRLWKLQKEVGAPKIRWGFDGGVDQRIIGAERATYNPFTNTAYVFPLTAFDDLIAEDAHAKQEVVAPVRTRFKGLRDQALVLMRIVTEWKDPKAVYGVLYSTPGSVENDAHSVIEPTLRDQLYDARPQRRSLESDEPEGAG